MPVLPPKLLGIRSQKVEAYQFPGAVIWQRTDNPSPLQARLENHRSPIHLLDQLLARELLIGTLKHQVRERAKADDAPRALTHDDSRWRGAGGGPTVGAQLVPAAIPSVHRTVGGPATASRAVGPPGRAPVAAAPSR